MSEVGVAIVTGGSRGIGRAVSLALGALGMNVAVGYRDNDGAADEVVAALRGGGVDALARRCDVAVDADCRALVAEVVGRWGRVDALVNNAGAGAAVAHAELEGLDDASWDRTFAVNARGAFAMTRAAAEALRASGAGAVVNVSSIGGASSSSIAYSASKAALDDVTRSLARVLAPAVRVNGVAPGFVATDRMRARFGERFAAMKQVARGRTLLDRDATPEHVARAVVSLIRDLDWVTGQTLVVDGGASVVRR